MISQFIYQDSEQIWEGEFKTKKCEMDDGKIQDKMQTVIYKSYQNLSATSKTTINLKEGKLHIYRNPSNENLCKLNLCKCISKHHNLEERILEDHKNIFCNFTIKLERSTTLQILLYNRDEKESLKFNYKTPKTALISFYSNIC
jgi:hypothetical protein